MSLRVVQVNCVIDEHGRRPADLLRAWPTLPLVAEAAAGAGADVHVVQASGRNEVLRQGDVTYHFVAEPRLGSGSGPGAMPWRLAARVRRIRPDVVHFHGFKAPAHLWALCRGPAPVLVQDHADGPRRRWKWFDRAAVASVAGYAFSTLAHAQPFIAAGLVRRELPIYEILESSTRFIPGSREDARARTGVFGDPALLWVGHFNANKDPLTILAAVAAALEHKPALQLWCAFGSNPLASDVEALLAARPQLRGHVHLLGSLENDRIEELCRVCDMFVLGSHHEATGFALLEALACGLVPVVSDIPSFRAITGGADIGALVTPGDAAGFSRAIVEQAAALTPNYRASVIAHFGAHLSPQVLGERLVAAYLDLISRAQDARRNGSS
jgi:glycosyltransferase involved in cell wall biosynthesis